MPLTKIRDKLTQFAVFTVQTSGKFITTVTVDSP